MNSASSRQAQTTAVSSVRSRAYQRGYQPQTAKRSHAYQPANAAASKARPGRCGSSKADVTDAARHQRDQAGDKREQAADAKPSREPLNAGGLHAAE